MNMLILNYFQSLRYFIKILGLALIVQFNKTYLNKQVVSLIYYQLRGHVFNIWSGISDKNLDVICDSRSIVSNQFN